MVSDLELINRLQEIIRSSDLEKTSVSSVHRQLEGEFRVSLTDKKGFIREQINSFIATHFFRNHNINPPPQLIPEEQTEEEQLFQDKEVNVSDDMEKLVGKDEEESGEEPLSNSVKVVKRKGGFSKPSALSPELQELVGVPELARTEVVKKIWIHIREKNLQDPNNKKKIICDKVLRAIFKVDTFDMYKINKLLSKHIWPIEEYGAIDTLDATVREGSSHQVVSLVEDLSTDSRAAKRQKIKDDSRHTCVLASPISQESADELSDYELLEQMDVRFSGLEVLISAMREAYLRSEKRLNADLGLARQESLDLREKNAELEKKTAEMISRAKEAEKKLAVAESARAAAEQKAADAGLLVQEKLHLTRHKFIRDFKASKAFENDFLVLAYPTYILGYCNAVDDCAKIWPGVVKTSDLGSLYNHNEAKKSDEYLEIYQRSGDLSAYWNDEDREAARVEEEARVVAELEAAKSAKFDYLFQ